MPREQTLLEPLSGAEIKQIILAKVVQALDRDCSLVDDICHPGFEFTFEGKLRFVRSNAAGALIWGAVSEGEKPAGDQVEEATIAADYKTDQPNLAREENDLPLPVLIQTPSGPKRQKVKFAKPERGSQWKPATSSPR